MNFEKFDVVILITMSIAVVGMSFTFPALGLTSADADENDIPEFDISADRFDFAGSFPDSPGTPSSGELWLEAGNTQGSDNYVDLDSDHNLVMYQDGNESDPDMEVALNDLANGNDTEVFFNNSEVGDTQLLEDFGYEIAVTLLQVSDKGTQDFEWRIRYEIRDEPDGNQGFLSRIPIVGGVVDAGEAVASMIGWIGSIIYWTFATLVQVILNLLGMLFDAMLFMVNLASWLIGTYGDVIASAGSWASVFVALPGILLFLELAKMVMIGISLLPTT